MDEIALQLIDYLRREVISGPIELTAETPLVSAGLVDSFALVDVLMEVERLTNTRIPASKVQPKDMDTVSLMIATAQRLGKPKE